MQMLDTFAVAGANDTSALMTVIIIIIIVIIIYLFIYLSKCHSDNITQYIKSSMSQSLRRRKAAHNTNT